jgi:hypothetical protein
MFLAESPFEIRVLAHLGGNDELVPVTAELLPLADEAL